MKGFTMTHQGHKSQLQLAISIEGNCYNQSLIEIEEENTTGITEEAIMNESMNKKRSSMIPYSKLSFLIPEYERKKCREREKQITNDC